MELLKPGHGLSNSQLTAKQIPDPDGDLRGWVHFAHSFNGYEYAGSLEACAAIANGGKASSLSELGCALFLKPSVIAIQAATPT